MMFKKDESLVNKTLKAYCHDRVPERVNAELWYEYIFNEDQVILVECRPDCKITNKANRLEFAKINYNEEFWWLYWMKSSDHWDRYETKRNLETIDEALEAINTDPHGCFYG